MSKLSQIVDRVKSLMGVLAVWEEVKYKVREEAPEFYGFLDALARDDHQAAARELLAWGSVVDAVAEVLRRADEMFPEEKMVRLMELARLPRS